MNIKPFSKLCNGDNRVYNNFMCQHHVGASITRSWDLKSIREFATFTTPLSRRSRCLEYPLWYDDNFGSNECLPLSDIMYYAGNEAKEYCSLENTRVCSKSATWIVFKKE